MVFALISAEILTEFGEQKERKPRVVKNISHSFSTVFLVMICFLYVPSTF